MVKKKCSSHNKIKVVSRRNPLHNHPLLGKGGTHNKSNKAKRRKETMAIKKEWLPQNLFLQVFFDEAAPIIANK